eukprot:1332540-Amorphochlora_amoeboformis.AAC.1
MITGSRRKTKLRRHSKTPVPSTCTPAQPQHIKNPGAHKLYNPNSTAEANLKENPQGKGLDAQHGCRTDIVIAH